MEPEDAAADVDVRVGKPPVDEVDDELVELPEQAAADIAARIKA